MLAYNGHDTVHARKEKLNASLTLRPLDDASQFPELASNGVSVL